MKKEIGCCSVFLIMLICPLGLLCIDKQIEDRDIVINLILWLVLTPIVAEIHALYLLDVTICNSILNILIPPIGTYMSTKSCSKAFIAFLLWLCFIVPGICYAHYKAVNVGAEDDNKGVELAPENYA